MSTTSGQTTMSATVQSNRDEPVMARHRAAHNASFDAASRWLFARNLYESAASRLCEKTRLEALAMGDDRITLV